MESKNDQIRIGFGARNDGQNGVMLSTPQGPITGDNGDHLCDGTVLLPEEARQLAWSLLFWADAITAGESIFQKRWNTRVTDPNKEAAIAEFLGAEKGGPLQ